MANQYVAGSRTTLENAALRANLGLLLYSSLPLALGLYSYSFSSCKHIIQSPISIPMNALHILFNTNRFNLSKVGEHFINLCCFGEDLAAWLRVKLIERKIEVPQLYQEDWGWELQANRGPDSYYLCVSGNADGSSRDEGEWRIFVEKKRSLWQRLSSKGRIAQNDEMTALIEEILSGDPTIRDVHREE